MCCRYEEAGVGAGVEQKKKKRSAVNEVSEVKWRERQHQIAEGLAGH